jgi:hypothetical protein
VAAPDRLRLIGFLDAATHLCEQLGLQRISVSHHGRQVRVLRLQVREDRGVLAVVVPKPANKHAKPLTDVMKPFGP